MKSRTLFCILAICLTLFLTTGNALFLKKKLPILSYLLKSKVGKVTAGLGALGIGGYAAFGGHGHGHELLEPDVEHLHHYHFEPVPVAVVAVPHSHHGVYHHSHHSHHFHHEWD